MSRRWANGQRNSFVGSQRKLWAEGFVQPHVIDGLGISRGDRPWGTHCPQNALADVSKDNKWWQYLFDVVDNLATHGIAVTKDATNILQRVRSALDKTPEHHLPIVRDSKTSCGADRFGPTSGQIRYTTPAIGGGGGGPQSFRVGNKIRSAQHFRAVEKIKLGTHVGGLATSPLPFGWSPVLPSGGETRSGAHVSGFAKSPLPLGGSPTL